MADTDDPITASYSIYLTPPPHPTTSQIYLLQYPNRSRTQPYNSRTGVPPSHIRIKPKSGYLEMDTPMHTTHKFNRYQALKWGDAVKEAAGPDSRIGQEGGVTYGVAAGLPTKPPARRGAATATGAAKDEAEREMGIQGDMDDFEIALLDGKVMSTQTLGGQIIAHESEGEEGKPRYFIGAFRGSELHLSQVTGTAQMRPVFHHVDAEGARERALKGGVYAHPGAAGDDAGAAETKAPPEKSRVVHQTYKSGGLANPRGELEEQVSAMKAALQLASEEGWTGLEFVDEDEEAAYRVWGERMFVRDVEGAVRLRSRMVGEEYLDAVSGKRSGSPTGVRKRRRKGSGGSDGDEG